nr:uncharacterized protein LOC129042016 [Pongo pygmaeus]
MWECLGLPRDLLNNFDQNADSDMDNKVQAEMVSDGDEELVGNWSKGHSCYAKRLAAFYPYPRDLWNLELERDNLGYLAEGISKQQSVQEEAEHKSLENLQPDDVIEKKNASSGEKFKPAAEICISNEEQNINHQDNGENVSRACWRSSWQPLPSQAQMPRREKWFPGLATGPPANVCSLRTWCPVSQLLHLWQRGPRDSSGHGFRGYKPQALAASTWCWSCRCTEDKN